MICFDTFNILYFLRGIIYVPFLFFSFPQNHYHLIHFNQSFHFLQLNIEHEGLLDQKNGINKRDLAQLSGLEQTKAERLNGAKLEVFYLEAYKGHSNLAIQRNASITFHSSYKLLVRHTWDKF